MCKGKLDHNLCLEQFKAANESVLAERGVACGWLSKGDSSTKSGHAESMEESGKVTLCEGKGQLPSYPGNVLFLLLALL